VNKYTLAPHNFFLTCTFINSLDIDPLKTIAKIFLSFLLLGSLQAQEEWLGYVTSNYAGINAVQSNPALITQTNYGKLDISLIAANVHVENNFLFVNSSSITDPVNVFSHPDFKHRYIRQNVDLGTTRHATIHANFQSPAFLLQITKKDAIGFCVRGRTFVNVDNVDRSLAQLAFEELDYPLNWNRNIYNDYLTVSANAWVEYDFTYARTWFQNDRYKLKGGITFKLLQGLMAAGIKMDNYSYRFYSDDSLALYNTNVQWGTNDHLYDQQFVFDFNSPGFAFDIGATLEYTPNRKTKYGLYRKKNNRKVKWPGIFAPDETTYKYKFGFSANDLGAIFYQRAAQTRDFFANVDTLPLSVFDGANSIAAVNGVLQNNFVMNGTDGNMTMIMPAHINLFADVRFNHNIALHSAFTMAFNNGSSTAFKNHYLYQLTFTPRWEIKWFGVYLPIWVTQYLNAPNMGISFRLGPLVIGTGDILGHLIKREYADIDLHMALRIIIPHRKQKGGNNVMNGGNKGGKKRKNDNGGATSNCEDFKPKKEKKQ